MWRTVWLSWLLGGLLLGFLACDTGKQAGEPCVALEVGGAAVLRDGAPEVELGGVARGQVVTAQVSVRTRAAGGERLTVDPMEDRYADAGYSWGAGSPVGTFALTPDAGLMLEVVYSPGRIDVGHGWAVLHGCEDLHLELMADVVDQVLTWSPAVLDFGVVDAGSVSSLGVTFENFGVQPVTLSQIGVSSGGVPSSAFHLAAGQPTELVVPAVTRDLVFRSLVPGRATVELTYTPSGASPETAVLEAHSSTAATPAIGVPLKGAGKP